jgi:hypothetical protein
MKKFIFVAAILSVVILFLPLKSYAVTASAVIDCNNELCDISPYIFGHNTSSVYYKAPLANQLVIDKVTRMGLGMHRFFPGAAGQRYDFKYNNYKGKYWNGGGTPAEPEPWRTDEATVPSIEDELRFCNAVGAEPLIEVNSAFVGPNGTHYDNAGNWTGGDDFASYTGYPGTDTPQTRAQYAADMVTYINSLCDINGWEHPVYYGIGNEPGWDSQSRDSFFNCIQAYGPAMKAVDPNIKITFQGSWDSRVIDVMDMYDFHSYAFADTGAPSIAEYVYCPGSDMDGSFRHILPNGFDRVSGILSGFASNLPGREPAMCNSEWGDHSYLPDQVHFYEYIGGIFTAHTFYRAVKNKLVFTCAWSFWSDWSWNYHVFGPPPEFKERSRYFVYEIYKNFGERLLECYDPSEYTPGVTDFFTEYKDDWDDLLVHASKRNADGSIAIMAINLSDTDSYDTQINLTNFDMGGVVEVYTMNQSNCYEGGPGPSMTTLTGQSNPINRTFAPWTVTCLVVKGESDVPVITNIAAGNITVAGATITWDTDRASTSQVEYGLTASYGNSTSEDSNLVTSHSVNLTGLAAGTEYHYRVICKDIESKESMSADYKFTTLGTGGVNVKVYPSPLVLSKGGQMTFSVGGATGGEVKIYTINGKLVRELAIGTGESEVSWDVLNEDGDSITTGLYLYTITDGDGNKETGKLAINH